MYVYACRIVESHEQISARLDAALAENKSLRDNSNSLQTRAQQVSYHSNCTQYVYLF